MVQEDPDEIIEPTPADVRGWAATFERYDIPAEAVLRWCEPAASRFLSEEFAGQSQPDTNGWFEEQWEEARQERKELPKHVHGQRLI